MRDSADTGSRWNAFRQLATALRRPVLFAFAVFATGYGVQQLLGRTGVDALATDIPQLAEALRAWSPWSALASIGLMILHSALPLPGEIITLANALIFGPMLGAVVTWIGAMLGAVVAYAAARYLGRNKTPQPFDPRLRDRLRRARTRPTTLLALRLVPVISFNLVNYAAGLLGVGWWTFIWTTSIGILPMILGISYFGEVMLEAPLWAWLVLAAVLVLAPAIMALLLRNKVERPGDAA